MEKQSLRPAENGKAPAPERDLDFLTRELGRRVREIRRGKNLSQQELGDRAEICKKYVGDIEKGVKNPSILILQRIAGVLGTSLADLFRPDPLASCDGDGARKRVIRSIMRELEKKSPAELVRVLEVLKALSRDH